MNADTQIELEIPPTFAPVIIRIRDGWKDATKRRTTREKGRKYKRVKLCPFCFKAFTSKGYARHLWSHKPKQP